MSSRQLFSVVSVRPDSVVVVDDGVWRENDGRRSFDGSAETFLLRIRRGRGQRGRLRVLRPEMDGVKLHLRTAS